MKKLLVAAGLTASIVASGIAFTAPAEAAANCPVDATYAVDFCLYYNSNMLSAYYRWTGSTSSVSNLAGYTFPNNGNGAGAGQAVKNNAAAASYRIGAGDPGPAASDYARIYFNSGYLGIYDDVISNTNKLLVNTYNEDASWREYGG